MKIIIINKIGEKVDEFCKKTKIKKIYIYEHLEISKQRFDVIRKSRIDNMTLELLIKISLVIQCQISDLFEFEVIE